LLARSPEKEDGSGSHSKNESPMDDMHVIGHARASCAYRAFFNTALVLHRGVWVSHPTHNFEVMPNVCVWELLVAGGICDYITPFAALHHAMLALSNR
jgi:hypothetical protein